MPGVVPEGSHSPRQIDPDPLAKLFGGLGVEPVSTGSGPDHRIITRDEIDPRFVVAPVTQAVQKSRIGRARIAADHRCDLRSGGSSRTQSQGAVIIPFVLLCEGLGPSDYTRHASSQATGAVATLCQNATRSAPMPECVSMPEFASPSVPCMTRFSQIDPQAPRGECPTMSVPIVARLRTEWRRWKGQASGRPPRRRAASRRPQVEGLEGRALLTASVTEYAIPDAPAAMSRTRLWRVRTESFGSPL